MLRSFPCCLRKFEVRLLSARSLVILEERREVWHSTRLLRWPTLSTLLEAEAESTSWPFPTGFSSVCCKKCFILLWPAEKPRPVAGTLRHLRTLLSLCRPGFLTNGPGRESIPLSLLMSVCSHVRGSWL